VPLAHRLRPEADLGESAGTQTFKSVEKSDVIMVIGANPTDGHPVFASRMKKRLRAGRQADRRRPAPHRPGEVAARQGRAPPAAAPGTNVARDHALAHVIVTEGLLRRAFIAERCEAKSFSEWREFVARPSNSPEATKRHRRAGRRAARRRAAVRTGTTASGNAAIYYGLGVTEHSQGSTMVMGIANLAMATGNVGREGVGVNPLRGQNNVQGSCDIGSFPHELPGYRHVSDSTTRAQFEPPGTSSCSRAGPAHPEHVRRRDRRQLQGPVLRRRGHRAVRPRHAARRRTRSWRWNASSCRTCS
jgi:formate dehydrogenase major subunit